MAGIASGEHQQHGFVLPSEAVADTASDTVPADMAADTVAGKVLVDMVPVHMDLPAVVADKASAGVLPLHVEAAGVVLLPAGVAAEVLLPVEAAAQVLLLQAELFLLHRLP